MNSLQKKILNEPELIQQYRSRLLSFIRSKINNPDDAEDILSKVFVKLVEQIDPPNNAMAWLITVSKRSIIDYYRAQKPNVELPYELANEEVSESEFESMTQCIKPMIQSLDEQFQQIVYQVDIEQVKQKKLADELKLSLPNLKSRLLRGRKQLKQKIINCCPPNVNSKGKIESFNDSGQTCECD